MNSTTLRTTFVVTIVAALLLSSPGAHAGKKAELKIAFIAFQNPEHLLENVEPVVKYLEKTLDVSIKKYVTTDYAATVEALRNGSADIGFMGPLQYVIAHEQCGAIPILGEVYGSDAHYQSYIFVRKDSGINSASDLRGKSIAFTDPISSSGYMYPLTIFSDEGLVRKDPSDFFGTHYFAGGDEQAIRAVFNGFVDAAGIGQFSFNLLRGKERNEVKVIAKSRQIPSHCVVVSKDLDSTLRDAFRDALLALNGNSPNHSLLKSLYGVDGYVKVTPETYKDVEALAEKHGFINR